MLAHLSSSDASITAPTCYFSLAVAPSSHFSLETPSTSPVADCSTRTSADPSHPLLAFRPAPLEPMSRPSDASRLLQLQTQAANRPSVEPLQPQPPPPPPQQQQQHRTSSTSSSASSDSAASPRNSMSPAILSCCRCRRESLAGMYQFGTNLYYCSHCARMVGYSAG